MSFPITITYANAPAGTCPTSIDQLIQLFRDITTSEISTSYTPYVLGYQVPSVEDQDKAWIRIDAAGRPLGTFIFYSGAWRRQYNGKFGEITAFGGNPALFFDGTGRGLTTGEWDGWALCNGQNGAPNLSDKFIVGSHMDNSAGQTGYSGSWRTMVSGSLTGSGGAASQTLTEAQVYLAAEDALVLDKYIADGNARNDTGKLYGEHSIATGPGGVTTVVAAEAGNTTPDPVTTLPPYYTLAYCIFFGYI